MSARENPIAAQFVGEERRQAEQARQHAIVSGNRLRQLLFSGDEDYMDMSQNYTIEDQYDLMSAVAQHYELQPDEPVDSPIGIAVPLGGLENHWGPEVNQPEFTISMSPFFIAGFRVVKRTHDDEPFKGKFIFRDRIEYSESANRLILERSAFKQYFGRYFERYVGTDVRVPTTGEISSIRDLVHASHVIKLKALEESRATDEPS